jgi:hypothetical protein
LQIFITHIDTQITIQQNIISRCVKLYYFSFFISRLPTPDHAILHPSPCHPYSKIYDTVYAILPHPSYLPSPLDSNST